MSEKEKGGGNVQMKKQGGRPFFSDPSGLDPLIYLIILIFTFFDGKHFMF